MRRGILLAVIGLLVLAGVWLSDEGGYLPERVGMPDLHRLYMASMRSDQQPPVILIHGIYGSRLRDRDGQERWPAGCAGWSSPR